jgi:hypothetical protein
MNHDGDDFNSSDIEFEERLNPFFAAGLDSVQAIMDHALEDRIESKKFSKTLTHAEGSRKTEYMTALWMNRFVAFRVSTLRKRYVADLLANLPFSNPVADSIV